MNKKWKHQQMLAEIRYAKQSKDLATGMAIVKMIVVLILRDGYGWDKSEIRVFVDMIPKFLALYHFGKLSQKEIDELIEEIRDDIGIDLLEPVLITPDMIGEGETDEGN